MWWKYTTSLWQPVDCWESHDEEDLEFGPIVWTTKASHERCAHTADRENVLRFLICVCVNHCIVHGFIQVFGWYLSILDFSSSLCTTKKSFIPSWHVQQLLQYTSTSMKVSPCLSGWADSLMAPLFALVRRVRLTTPTLTPTPQYSPYNLPFRVRKQPQRVLREEKVLYLIISSLHNE